MWWGKGHVAGMGNLYRILVGKPEGQRSFGRRRYRWEHNIKMEFEELGLGVDRTIILPVVLYGCEAWSLT
jgi:hypothetical protein